MERYKFSLHFALPDFLKDAAIRFQESDGPCADAVVKFRGNKISMRFERSEKSAYRAIFLAISDVRSVIPEASLKSVSPDLIPADTLCRIIKISQEELANLCTSAIDQFPMAKHSSEGNFWHLSEVLQWMSANNHSEVNQAMYEVSQVTHQLNAMTKDTHTKKKEADGPIPMPMFG